MSGMSLSASAYLDRPLRSLGQYRDELAARMRALPPTDRERAGLARRIVDIEDEIDRLRAAGPDVLPE